MGNYVNFALNRISEDAKRMENILRNSNEKRKEIEKDQ